MLTRLLVAAVLMSLPLGALADDAAPDSASAPAATASPSSDGSAAAAGLGPQTSTGPAGGSNADASALQPAGLAPVQSSAADSTGLSAPASALQAPAATSDQLQVLSGEADGAPKNLDDGSSDPLWPWVGVVASALVLVALAVLWRDRRRFGAGHPDQPQH